MAGVQFDPEVIQAFTKIGNLVGGGGGHLKGETELTTNRLKSAKVKLDACLSTI